MPKKTVSERQLAANRANARKSTGPRTPEGKEQVSTNAIKHGLIAHRLLLPNDPEESAAELEALRARFQEEIQPQSVLEQILIERLAACYWRLRRIYQFETNSILRARDESHTVWAEMARSYTQIRCFPAQLPGDDPFDKILRFETMIERTIHRTILELSRLRGGQPITLPPMDRDDPIFTSPLPSPAAKPAETSDQVQPETAPPPAEEEPVAPQQPAKPEQQPEKPAKSSPAPNKSKANPPAEPLPDQDPPPRPMAQPLWRPEKVCFSKQTHLRPFPSAPANRNTHPIPSPKVNPPRVSPGARRPLTSAIRNPSSLRHASSWCGTGASPGLARASRPNARFIVSLDKPPQTRSW